VPDPLQTLEAACLGVTISAFDNIS
jgi:hypothetical protein